MAVKIFYNNWYALFQKFFLICAMITMLLPVLFFEKGDKTAENRVLATFPNDIGYDEYPSQIETWLNDRFGFRSQLITLNRNILFHLFKVSPSKQIIIGKDGYSWHSSEGARNSITAYRLGMEYNEQTLASRVELAIASFEKAKALNIPNILFVSIPSKEFYTADKFPLYLKLQLKDEYFSDPFESKVITALSEELQNYFMFPIEDIKLLNDKVPAYPNKNFHWVPYSPMTDQVAALIAERFHKEPIYPVLSEYDKLCAVDSDVSHLAGIKFKNLPFYCREELPNVNEFMYENFYNDPNPNIAATWGTAAFANSNETGKLLVIGDSFAPSIANSLSRYFSESVAMDYGHLRFGKPGANEDMLTKIIADYRPDYLVILTNSRFADISGWK